MSLKPRLITKSRNSSSRGLIQEPKSLASWPSLESTSLNGSYKKFYVYNVNVQSPALGVERPVEQARTATTTHPLQFYLLGLRYYITSYSNTRANSYL
jgi:hypothetical protein